MNRIKLTNDQWGVVRAATPEDAVITLTRDQEQMLRHDWAYERSAKDALEVYKPVVEELVPDDGLEVELFHSGGFIWLTRVQWHDAPEDWSGPFIYISPSEVTQGQWLVGLYLNDEDEGFEYTETKTEDLQVVVRAGLEKLGELAISPEEWLEREIWNVRDASSSRSRKLPRPPHGYEVTVMVDPVDLAIMEVDSGMTSGYSAYSPIVIMFDDHTTQRFALWWTDHVANDWTEWFDSYHAVLRRYAQLFLAVAYGKHFDEVDMEVAIRARPLEKALAHFTEKHPELDEWEIREWYGIPYRADGVLNKEGTVLVMYYDSSKSGDGDIGRSEWMCLACDEPLNIDSIDVEG